MKAIILAAGIGNRLGEISGNKPKCLLEFDGISLLRRQLNQLQQYEISDVIVVTGYLANEVIQEIASSGAENITKTIHNPDFRKGSAISLLLGLEYAKIDEDLILMDADVLYDLGIIERLINTDISNCFLLDRNFVPGDEPVKLCVQNGLLVDFRKQIDPGVQFEYQGESVGFFRFSAEIINKLMNRAKSWLEHDDEAPYEEVIRDVLLEDPHEFGFEDITGLAWIEIDFPEDIARAQTEILPLIN